MHPRLIQLARFKCAIYRAWKINLFQPAAAAPLPGHIWRRMGAA